MAILTGLVLQYETTEYSTKLLPYRQMFLNYGIYNPFLTKYKLFVEQI